VPQAVAQSMTPIVATVLSNPNKPDFQAGSSAPLSVFSLPFGQT